MNTFRDSSERVICLYSYWLHLTLALFSVTLGCVNQGAQRQSFRTPAPPVQGPVSSRVAPAGSPPVAPGDQASDTPAPILEAGPQSTIKVFDKAHSYWVSKNDNHRSIKQVVDFPKQIFLYESVQLRLKLECPQPTCDAWDRRGAIYLYRDNMKTDDAGQRVELARFVTPYGVGTSWTVDIAPLAPLLVGKRTLELEIDTWVGPGHPQGAGWLVTAEVEMKGGRPKEYPVAVISVFHPQDVEVGDPAKDPRRVFTHEVPISDVSSAKLVAIITGHGQGNSENCAEFCPKTHNFTIGGKLQQRRVWRDNCAQTVADQSQRGTWTLSRAGWCPGAAVKPLIFDLGAGQARLAIEYEPQTYANQARSGYNDGSHTPPYYRMSAVVVLYRQL